MVIQAFLAELGLLAPTHTNTPHKPAQIAFGEVLAHVDKIAAEAVTGSLEIGSQRLVIDDSPIDETTARSSLNAESVELPDAPAAPAQVTVSLERQAVFDASVNTPTRRVKADGPAGGQVPDPTTVNPSTKERGAVLDEPTHIVTKSITSDGGDRRVTLQIIQTPELPYRVVLWETITAGQVAEAGVMNEKPVRASEALEQRELQSAAAQTIDKPANQVAGGRAPNAEVRSPDPAKRHGHDNSLSGVANSAEKVTVRDTEVRPQTAVTLPTHLNAATLPAERLVQPGYVRPARSEGTVNSASQLENGGDGLDVSIGLDRPQSAKRSQPSGRDSRMARVEAGTLRNGSVGDPRLEPPRVETGARDRTVSAPPAIDSSAPQTVGGAAKQGSAKAREHVRARTTIIVKQTTPKFEFSAPDTKRAAPRMATASGLTTPPRNDEAQQTTPVDRADHTGSGDELELNDSRTDGERADQADRLRPVVKSEQQSARVKPTNANSMSGTLTASISGVPASQLDAPDMTAGRAGGESTSGPSVSGRTSPSGEQTPVTEWVTLHIGDRGSEGARVRVAVRGSVVNASIAHPDERVVDSLRAHMHDLHNALAQKGFTGSRVSLHTSNAVTTPVITGAAPSVSSAEYAEARASDDELRRQQSEADDTYHDFDDRHDSERQRRKEHERERQT